MINKTSTRFLPVIVLLASGVSGCATIGQTPAEETAIEQDVVYEVQRGDQLGSIAERLTGQFDLWSAIAAHNDISDPRTLAEGQILRIPITLVRPNERSVTESSAQSPVRETTSVGRRASSPISVPTGNAVSVVGGLSSATDDNSDITISSIDVNRTFDLKPLPLYDATSSDNKFSDDSVAPQIRVSGTYFPKAIYQEPANYARLIQRAAPGTVFPLESKVNTWYKIITDEGVGYIRESDSLLVD